MKTIAILTALGLCSVALARPAVVKPTMRGTNNFPAPIGQPNSGTSEPATAAAVTTAPGTLSAAQVVALAETYMRQAQNLRILAVQFPEASASLNGQALSFERAAEMLLESAK